MKHHRKLTTGLGGIGINITCIIALLAIACSKAQLPTTGEPEGELVILVNQDSALVSVKDLNNNLIAESRERYSSHKLIPGDYIVTGEKEGRLPVQQIVGVIPNQETVVHLELSAPPVDPPNLSFSVGPDSVQYGDAVILQWASNGFQVVIDQGVGTRGPSGSEEIVFENPGKKLFTATAYGPENVLTIKRDSTFVKEAPAPILPVVMLSATSKVTVNTPAKITWFSQNADYVVVDFINDASLQGSEEVTFTTPGIRIVTATAFNQAGYISTTDTIEVVEPEVTSVDDIIVSSESWVRADKGEVGFLHADAAVFEIDAAGKYQVVTEVWYNSGDSQLNESFYLQIRDGDGKISLPQNPNAGIYNVVPDDPGEPHTASRESGIFKLSKGTNSIDLIHYAKISTYYPDLLNGPITGPESVKILGFRLVYLGN